jgi:hypothetical protein
MMTGLADSVATAAAAATEDDEAEEPVPVMEEVEESANRRTEGPWNAFAAEIAAVDKSILEGS